MADVGVWVALSSGAALVLLGGALLAVPRRRSEQLFFGLFAILWGAIVASANLAVLFDDPALFRILFLTAFALNPGATIFLAQFAASIDRTRLARALALAAVVFGIAATAVLVIRPSLVVESITTDAGSVTGAVLGPTAFPLFVIPLFGMFYAALLVIYRAYRRSDPGSSRRRVRAMVLALAAYTSYQTVANLIVFSGAFGGLSTVETNDGLAIVVFGIGAVVVAGIAVHAWRRPVAGEGPDRLLLAALLVPAVVPLVTEQLDPTGGLDSYGLWRLLAVALIVHAIARYQLFDLDVRLKHSTRRAFVVGAFVGVFFFATELAEALVADAWGTASGFAAAAALTLVFRPLDRAADSLADRLFPNVSDDYDYLQARRLEVYEVALERTLDEWDPHQTWDDEVMRGLRKNLGITRGQHDAILDRLLKRGRYRIPARGLGVVQPGEHVAGRYRVDRLLGQGSYGRAFLAYDSERDREVVLKVVSTAALGGRAAAMLLREAEAMRRIEHPHVVRFHDVLEGPHEVVLVLEYADGGTLRGLVDRRGRVGISEATRILDLVLAGLAATHGAGLVHRDLKPENVLLTKDGRVMLADFGIARDEGPEATALTAGPAGTLLYMAPEQVRGGEVTPATDLYAAAVLYHELLTGRSYLPLAGADDYTIRKRILEHEPVLAIGNDRPWLRAFLNKALAKDPVARFTSADEMRAALVLRVEDMVV